jgi:hypothetical protein
MSISETVAKTVVETPANSVETLTENWEIDLWLYKDNLVI